MSIRDFPITDAVVGPIIIGGEVENPTPMMHARRMLESLGIDLNDPNWCETPERFVRYLNEFRVPYNAVEILKTFPSDTVHADSMVVQSNIPFRAVCAHHLLPFVGRAHVGYIPKDRVVGLSKLTRLVHAVSHESPSLQELIGDKVADELMEVLQPLGAMCVISAEHMCMACRGVEGIDVVTTTSAIRGVFQSVTAARVEFFNLLQAAQQVKL
jgi:GTP cyclohydrolase I